MSKFALNPQDYHWNNSLLDLSNVMLVFYLVRRVFGLSNTCKCTTKRLRKPKKPLSSIPNPRKLITIWALVTVIRAELKSP